jgi:hypothetical protein
MQQQMQPATIVMCTTDFQQGFQTGLNGGLCSGYRFKLELPVDEESIVTIIRNLCEIAQEQSSPEQVKHNKQSTMLQDEELARRLIKMGWSEVALLR